MPAMIVSRNTLTRIHALEKTTEQPRWPEADLISDPDDPHPALTAPGLTEEMSDRHWLFRPRGHRVVRCAGFDRQRVPSDVAVLALLGFHEGGHVKRAEGWATQTHPRRAAVAQA